MSATIAGVSLSAQSATTVPTSASGFESSSFSTQSASLIATCSTAPAFASSAAHPSIAIAASNTPNIIDLTMQTSLYPRTDTLIDPPPL